MYTLLSFLLTDGWPNAKCVIALIPPPPLPLHTLTNPLSPHRYANVIFISALSCIGVRRVTCLLVVMFVYDRVYS